MAEVKARNFINPRDPKAIAASRNKRARTYTFNLARMLQLKRKGEMGELYRDRLRRAAPIGREEKWALLIADVAAFLFSTLEHEFETVRGHIGIRIRPELIDRAIAEVSKKVQAKGHAYRPISADRAGDDLEVLLDEVLRLGLKRFWAVDEPYADREARIKETRQEADRRRKRAKRSGEPRRIYEGMSVSRSRPWEAEGISRATWYRRRKKENETSLSAPIFKESVSDTVVSNGLRAESNPSSPQRIKRAIG